MIKQYELSQKDYVPIREKGKVNYGGSQQWFSDRLPGSRQARIHQYGCGVIAASDLFMYWAMTLPYKNPSPALKSLEKDGSLLKENYINYVEHICERYVHVLPKVGVPNLELILAVNSYALLHHIPYKAQIGYLMDERKLLRKIVQMIKGDLPVILLIGTPFPEVLYRTLLKNKKAGIPFYELKEKEEKRTYITANPSVRGHYVTVTGMVIDKEADDKKEKVMLKISSWGKTYYISWFEYCQYEMKYGVDLQGSIISLSAW